MDSFSQLQLSVKKALNDDLQKGKIDVFEMMAAMYICGQARDEEQLREAIDMFSEDFGALGYVLSQEQGHERETFETDVQDVLSRMLKDNPTKATEVAKYIEGKDVTISDLIEEFPEVKNYLN